MPDREARGRHAARAEAEDVGALGIERADGREAAVQQKQRRSRAAVS
jgi:hypothetical protein